METKARVCCNEGMEEYKPFKIVSVLQGGTTFNIDSVYDASKYITEQWPEEEHGPKYLNCLEILLKCPGGRMHGCGCPCGICRSCKGSRYLR